MNSNKKEPKRKIVVLTITEQCNLNCIYCFEKAKTSKTMSLDVAKAAVEHEFKNSDLFDELEFDLFGGEPTLCKAVIQELVEWTEARDFCKPYLFFIETNGTLVHGEFQEWLVRHKRHVYAGLSLDGTPTTHNRNRSNSYDKIDIPFFATNYPNQSVRMTVFSETIRSLAADVIHLHKLGFSDVVATFAHGITWNKDDVRTVLPEELHKLCAYYLEHPEVTECSIFDMHLPAILQENGPTMKWCGTGTNMISYDPDGTSYPCHTFQSNTTSPGKAVKCGQIDFEAMSDFRDPECAHCVLEPICPNCYGMNYVKNGDILKRDRGLCDVVKVQSMAVSYLRAKQIEAGVKRMSPNETYNTIAAIKVIQGAGITV